MSLAKLRAEQGEVAQSAAILAMLDEVEDFFSVDPFTKPQRTMLIQSIVKSYYYLKVSDLKLFADKFKAGMYGKIYNRIDGGVIMEGMKLYDTERAEEAAVFSQMKHGEIKHEEKKTNPKVIEVIENVFSKAQTTEKDPKPVFSSIAAYCRYMDLNPKEIEKQIEDKARKGLRKSGMDMELEDYKKYLTAVFLDSESRNK